MVSRKALRFAMVFCFSVIASLTGTISCADNSLILIEGQENLVNVQSSESNILFLSISGNDNGGFGSAWPSISIFQGVPGPGRILQTGLENSSYLSVQGQENLFSLSQNGLNNTISGIMSGSINSAIISQVGNRNHVGFSQIGTRNSLKIYQEP